MSLLHKPFPSSILDTNHSHAKASVYLKIELVAGRNPAFSNKINTGSSRVHRKRKQTDANSTKARASSNKRARKKVASANREEAPKILSDEKLSKHDIKPKNPASWFQRDQKEQRTPVEDPIWLQRRQEHQAQKKKVLHLFPSSAVCFFRLYLL